MYVTEEKNGKMYALPAGEIKYSGAQLAGRMLALLARKPSYAKEIAYMLRENEQKIYYHIRKLERAGMIRIVRKEERGGAVAKFYALSKPAFVLRFSEMKEIKKLPKSDLPPFIIESKMNAKIVVGSPDPHGPERARSRDVHYAIDLGLFLGTFLTESQPSMHLDTDMRGEDLRDNLIVIGGPVINRITAMINDKMPVRFDSKKKNIFSIKTKKVYKSDDAGLIVKMPNPFSKDKSILIIAGKRYSGTRAAILAIIKHPDLLQKKSTVVQGLDRDYDGIVDDVEILK